MITHPADHRANPKARNCSHNSSLECENSRNCDGLLGKGPGLSNDTMTTSFPPHVLHSSTRIPTSKALSLLSEYLSAAETDASLHPNALLTENGPITPSSGVNTGPVLHNLKRIKAGLEGKHLGADLTFKEFGGEGLPGLRAGDAVAGANEIPVDGLDDGAKPDGDMGSEWQDKEEFEREQDVVQGEIGKRDNAVEGGVKDKAGTVPVVQAPMSQKDKEARKKAKYERRQKERKKREEKRKEKKEAHSGRG